MGDVQPMWLRPTQSASQSKRQSNFTEQRDTRAPSPIEIGMIITSSGVLVTSSLRMIRVQKTPAISDCTPWNSHHGSELNCPMDEKRPPHTKQVEFFTSMDSVMAKPSKSLRLGVYFHRSNTSGRVDWVKPDPEAKSATPRR